MNLLPFALLLLLTSLQQPSTAIKWDVCSKTKETKSAIAITDIAVTPEPIIAGTSTLFQLTAYQQIQVGAGKLSAQVRYLGFKVFSKDGELCEVLDCPMLPGPSVLNFTQHMPGYLPPGKLVLTVEALRNDSLLLFCVDIELSSSSVTNTARSSGAAARIISSHPLTFSSSSKSI